MSNRRANKKKAMPGVKTGVKTNIGGFKTDIGDLVVKRMSFPSTLATGAGTSIPLTSISSAFVQSGPASEWTSFAARFQEYRVRAIRVCGYALCPVETATITHGGLLRGDYLGVSTPGTLAQVLSDERSRVTSSGESFCDVITWSRNPNAKLWSSTSVAIPTANTYSWVCISSTSLTTATTYYFLTLEWEVEFRGSQ